ncbi:MAG: AtpZ/AtpI family protein [Saprospiraceae bacterium]
MPPNDPQKKQKHDPMAYMKYAGMAFQMAAVMFIGVYIGGYLDEKFGSEKPYFTLVCILIALVAAFYLTLKDLLIPPKK